MEDKMERALRSIEGFPAGEGWVITEFEARYNSPSMRMPRPHVKVAVTLMFTGKDREIVFSARLPMDEWEQLIRL